VTPYATVEDLTEWLPTGTAIPADAARVLGRASTLLDSVIRAPFGVDDEGLPTDETVAETLANACCAQVEYWIDLGEEHDIEGMAGTRVGVGHLQVERLPLELGPRARRELAVAGLTTPVVAADPVAEVTG
jgi:hypothetical protein